MAIEFDAERWAHLRRVYARWWAGESDRPVVPVELWGRDPGRECPPVPLLAQETCADFTWTPEQIVDRLDYELSTRVFLGDAFPRINMDCFGPGVAGAFLGATLDNSSGRVWFFPPDDLPIDKIHLTYDPENPWLRRVRDICAAAMRRWQGQVLVTMTDLGGNLDIVSTFRPSERLLLDLYDSPDEVKRLLWEAHEAWHRFYADLNSVLQPSSPGYSDWSGIYSDRPAYILQCDFCYMVGPAMFDEFVRPELVATCRRLGRAFYHLDGVGQLPHLDSLLRIEELSGVQWVPGDGKPGCGQWPEVYAKILGAGKLAQVLGGPDELDALAASVGHAGRMQLNGWWPGSVEVEADVRRRLETYGIE